MSILSVDMIVFQVKGEVKVILKFLQRSTRFNIKEWRISLGGLTWTFSPHMGYFSTHMAISTSHEAFLLCMGHFHLAWSFPPCMDILSLCWAFSPYVGHFHLMCTFPPCVRAFSHHMTIAILHGHFHLVWGIFTLYMAFLPCMGHFHLVWKFSPCMAISISCDHPTSHTCMMESPPPSSKSCLV